MKRESSNSWRNTPLITGQRIFEEICKDGYGGGISILRDRLRILWPTPKKALVIRFETDPGVQGQMDWSPYTIKFLRTGKAAVQCFSYILGFSRRHYIDFTTRQDFFTLIRRHLDAFAHFGGTPSQCLYDSEKTVVLRWEAGRPLIIRPSLLSPPITGYGYGIPDPSNQPRIQRTVHPFPRSYREALPVSGRSFRRKNDQCLHRL